MILKVILDVTLHNPAEKHNLGLWSVYLFIIFQMVACWRGSNKVIGIGTLAKSKKF